MEAANRPGAPRAQNQPFSSVTHSTSSQSFSQVSTQGQPPASTQVTEGITLSRQSPDSGSGLLYTSANSNMSLSNMNSGKEENLQSLQSTGDEAVTAEGDDGRQSQSQSVCRRPVNSTNNGKAARPYSHGDFVERRNSVVLVSENDISHVQFKSQRKHQNHRTNSSSAEGIEKSQSLRNIPNTTVSSKLKSNSFLSEEPTSTNPVGGVNNNSGRQGVEIPSVKVVGFKEVQKYNVSTTNSFNNNFTGKIQPAVVKPLMVVSHATGSTTNGAATVVGKKFGKSNKFRNSAVGKMDDRV